MQANNGIDLDDLFGTKPPAPPASGAAADDLPPPYDGPALGSPYPPPPAQPPQASDMRGQAPNYGPEIPWGAPPIAPAQQPATFAPPPQSYGAVPPVASQPPQYVNGASASSYTPPYTSPYPTGVGYASMSPPQQQHQQHLQQQSFAPGSSSSPAPAASPEDDDRAQLEKIIRLRRELEQEQERERQKKEELQTWSCAQCTYRSKLESTACEMCGVPRPGYPRTATSGSGSGSTAVTSHVAAVPAPSSPPRPAGATAWQCGVCLAPNEVSDARCRVCQAYKASGTPIAAGGPAPATTAAPAMTTDWMCSVCGKVNPPSAAHCRVCHGYQRNGTPVAGSGGSGGSGAPRTAAAAPTVWSCPVCTFDNATSAAVCEACGTGRRPAHVQPAAPAKGSEAGDATSKKWPCPTCTFENKMRRSKCDMCGTARPAKYAQEKGATDKAEKKREEQSDDDEVQWQDDNVAKACNRCHQEFGMLRRRHHCRKCGYVFCATCSPFYLTSKKSALPERVCVSCYEAQKGKT